MMPEQLWPFEPNWEEPVTERLEWVTDILASDNGAEQRRSLRIAPRTEFEFALAVEGPERAFLDNLLITHGAGTWLLPVWHAVEVVAVSVASGASTLTCGPTADSLFEAGMSVVIMNDAFTWETATIQSVGASSITLTTALTNDWAVGTRVMPIRKARLLEQPTLRSFSDAAVSADMQFQIVEAQGDPATVPGLVDMDSYLGFAVLHQAPEERETLDRNYERMVVTFDNGSHPVVWKDKAGRAFTMQQFGWTLEGRAQHRAFETMLKGLRGRGIPLWVPTYMRDFEVVEDIDAGDTTLAVGRCGFTQAGGPRDDRQHLMIETASVTYYRKIADSAEQSDGSETLLLNTALPAAVAADDVLRVCFMTLMRLNSDTVEIGHLTDDSGISEVQATLRSAPDLRIVQPGI